MSPTTLLRRLATISTPLTTSTLPTSTMHATPLPLPSDEDTISDTTLLLFFWGFILLIIGITTLCISLGIRAERKAQALRRAKLDADLEAAFPEQEERRKWLLERKLEVSYGFLNCAERIRWLDEGIEGVEGFKDVKGA